MAKIIGIGGIFFKSSDPDALKKWYFKHLGIPATPDGNGLFRWQESDEPHAEQLTVWAAFDRGTTYFDPSKAAFMINYIVDDLDGMLAELRASGAQVEDKTESAEYGRFGWAIDPEGNRFELWEPPKTTT